MGISCVIPFGSDLLIEIGRASSSSSIIAVPIGPLYGPSMGMKAGAPIAIWRDLAPTIRALSKRVSFGGPILISNSARDGCLAFFTVFVGDIRGPRGWLRPLWSEDKSFSQTLQKQIKGQAKGDPVSSQAPPAAGSVSKVECTATVGGKGKGTVSLFRHLAPVTVNSILRSLPSNSRVNLQPSMVCLFTDLRVGVEKPRTQFVRGDVAYLPSGGLICVFLGDARSDRPLNPVGKVESGIETFDSIRRGDVVHLELGGPAPS